MSWEAALATTDRAVVAQLGRAVTYTPDGEAGVAVRGIFDDGYLRATPGSPGVSTSTPAIFFILADLPSDPESDDPRITVGAEVFEVVEVKKDSNGVGVLLVLQAVS